MSQIPKDFFGRPIVYPEGDENASPNQKLKVPRIWYKFHEGYSNAVRRRVTVADIAFPAHLAQ
jgi:hypothetical protein